MVNGVPIASDLLAHVSSLGVFVIFDKSEPGSVETGSHAWSNISYLEYSICRVEVNDALTLFSLFSIYSVDQSML